MTKEEFLEQEGLDEEGFFSLMFNKTWNVLERHSIPDGKISAYIENLQKEDFFDVNKAFKWFFKNGRTVNGKRQTGFPTGPEMLEQIKIIKQTRGSNITKFVKPVESNKVKAMTDQAVASEFKRWLKFYEAYPYPDVREGATKEECDAVDVNYQNIMRKNKFDPNEFNIRANKLFIRGLLDSMFMTSDNLPYDKKTGYGRPWKESLKQYEFNKQQLGMIEVKECMLNDSF